MEEIMHDLVVGIQLHGGTIVETQWIWDYWNAVFFSLSIVTTIGML
jgi:hypothetical protein